MPSVVQNRGLRERQVFRHGHDDRIGSEDASLLNFRTEVVQTPVSRLGNMFSTTRLPFRVAEFQRGEVAPYQFEIGSLDAGPDEFAVDMHGVPLNFVVVMVFNFSVVS